MSVVSNPLIFEALFGGLEEKSTVDNVSSALSPEPVVKAGQYFGSLGTLNWNQIRYTVTYGDISVYLYYFTEIGYGGSATSSNPDTVYIPLPEIPTNLDQYQSTKVVSVFNYFADSSIFSVSGLPASDIGEPPETVPPQGPTFEGPNSTVPYYNIKFTISLSFNNEALSLLLFYINPKLVLL